MKLHKFLHVIGDEISVGELKLLHPQRIFPYHPCQSRRLGSFVTKWGQMPLHGLHGGSTVWRAHSCIFFWVSQALNLISPSSTLQMPWPGLITPRKPFGNKLNQYPHRKHHNYSIKTTKISLEHLGTTENHHESSSKLIQLHGPISPWIILNRSHQAHPVRSHRQLSWSQEIWRSHNFPTCRPVLSENEETMGPYGSHGGDFGEFADGNETRLGNPEFLPIQAACGIWDSGMERHQSSLSPSRWDVKILV